MEWANIKDTEPKIGEIVVCMDKDNSGKIGLAKYAGERIFMFYGEVWPATHWKRPELKHRVD